MSMLWLSVVDGQIHVPVATMLATQFLLLVKKVPHLQSLFCALQRSFGNPRMGHLSDMAALPVFKCLDTLG